MIKRSIDIVAAAISLPFLAVGATAICALIRIESKGSPIFKQERVGRHGAVFTLYKFRTMAANTGDHPTHEVTQSSVTRVGKFLRRSKLDELPQLWNVLRGEMSLVGPRPSLPSQTELVEERRARGVLSLRPGITGTAQLAGMDMSDPVGLAAVDAQYMELASTSFDLRCVLDTALGRGAGDRVSRSQADSND